MRGRGERPLFVIDIAVPRDVEPSANDVEGVYLYDIDSLQEIARQAMDARRLETDACERIIRGHVEEFAAWAGQGGMPPRDQRQPAAVEGIPAR